MDAEGSIVVGGSANLTVDVPASVPSGLSAHTMRGVSVTLPTPTLDSRGRPS